ncbi:MAG: hypothetical protein J6P29_02390 [Acetobacter sp.]|nr:hypothetical protein [Acetobacter sp.]
MNNKHHGDYTLESGIGRLQDSADEAFDKTLGRGVFFYNKYWDKCSAFFQALLDVTVEQPLLVVFVSAIGGFAAGSLFCRTL